MVMRPTTTTQEVPNLIHRMTNKQGTDLSGIGNAILRCCSPIIEPYLCDLIGRSVENKVSPKCLKVTKVRAFTLKTICSLKINMGLDQIGIVSKQFAKKQTISEKWVREEILVSLTLKSI